VSEETVEAGGAAPAIVASGEAALSDRAKDMTTEDKIAYSAKLNIPWQKPMLSLLEAYMQEYPPKTTRSDVLAAVSVSLPLRAFVALMSAAQCVIIKAGEDAVREAA
jgi:hypothetical protein